MFVNNYQQRKKEKTKDQQIAELQAKTERQDQVINDLLLLTLQRVEGSAE